MSVFDRMRRAVSARETPDAMDARIDEEMAFHVAMRTEELVRRGIPPAMARREAEKALGHRTGHVEAARETRSVRWLETFWRESRTSARSLRRQPGLVITAVLSLGLGIGANVAIFAVFDAVALQPLPIAELDRVVAIREIKAGEPTNGNPLRLADWGREVRGFSSVAGYYGESSLLGSKGDVSRFPVARTFGDLFGVTGGRLVAGRLFTVEERSGEPVAILRERSAIRLFGGATTALARSVVLDGFAYTVIGVVGDETYPAEPSAWLPAPRGLQTGSRAASFLFTLGRMGREVDVEDVANELAVVQERLAVAHPETDAGRTIRLEPLQSAVLGETRAAMVVVQIIAVVVLGIACLNLAGLLIARAAKRQRESAIRAALGAGRASLVRLYLGESMLLGLIGAAAGVAVAMATLALLRRAALPLDLPRIDAAHLDLRATVLAIVLGLAAILLFGSGPALVAARGSLVPSLSRSPLRSRGRAIAVAGQAGLAIILLLAAGALLFGVRRLDRDRGYSAAGVLAVRIGFSWGTPDATVHGFADRALTSFATLPGVRAVGLADRLPLEGNTQSSAVSIVGQAPVTELADEKVLIRAISRGYFEALGVPIARGTTLGDRGTAVVNDEFARRWLGDHPIGARVTVFGDQTVEVVGVVPGVRQSALENRVAPEIFIDARETHWPLLVFLLRTDGDPVGLAAGVKARVAEIDRGLLIDEIEPLEGALAAVTRTPRQLSVLTVGFALVAIGLVGVGLYGMLAGYVNQRMTEIGVRLAVGASPRTIAFRVAWQGLRLVGIGVVVGMAAWMAWGGSLRRLPVEVAPNEPMLLLIALVSFAIIGVVVSAGPAIRAARLDPIRTLRAE